MIRKTLLAGVALIALGAGPAFAQTNAPAATPGTAATAPAAQTKKLADAKFVRQAAVGGMAEVELAQLAQQKSQNAQVKQFADMMVKDHTQANDELKGIVTAKGGSVPATLDKKHAQLKTKLSGLSGAAFDRAYASAMVDGHTEMLALMKGEASGGKDAELKAFAAKTAPVVDHHLGMAKDLQHSAGGKTS